MRIRSDIARVVVADEPRLKDRHVGQQGHEGEPQANKRRLPQPLHVEFPEGGVFRHGRVNPNGAYFLSCGFPVCCRERYIMENESTRINTNDENNKNHGLSATGRIRPSANADNTGSPLVVFIRWVSAYPFPSVACPPRRVIRGLLLWLI